MRDVVLLPVGVSWLTWPLRDSSAVCYTQRASSPLAVSLRYCSSSSNANMLISLWFHVDITWVNFFLRQGRFPHGLSTGGIRDPTCSTMSVCCVFSIPSRVLLRLGRTWPVGVDRQIWVSLSSIWIEVECGERVDKLLLGPQPRASGCKILSLSREALCIVPCIHRNHFNFQGFKQWPLIEIDSCINCFCPELNGSLRVDHCCQRLLSNSTEHSFRRHILMPDVWRTWHKCSTAGHEIIREALITILFPSISAQETNDLITHWVFSAVKWLVGGDAGLGFLIWMQPYR
jgi:hypothetical protein